MVGPLFGRHECQGFCRAHTLCFLSPSPTFQTRSHLGQHLKAVADYPAGHSRVFSPVHIRSFSLVSFILFIVMFSFRKRPKDTSPIAPSLRASPSLPELYAQGIPWPENLVDATVLNKSDDAAPSEVAHETRQQGAAKTSLHSLDRAPVLFHKPFRLQLGPPAQNGTSISSLYMSQPSPAFENWRKSTAPSTATATTRRAHKKNRNPPAFNLMVSATSILVVVMIPLTDIARALA